MQCIELESSWAAPLFLVRCSMLVRAYTPLNTIKIWWKKETARNLHCKSQAMFTEASQMEWSNLFDFPTGIIQVFLT